MLLHTVIIIPIVLYWFYIVIDTLMTVYKVLNYEYKREFTLHKVVKRNLFTKETYIITGYGGNLYTSKHTNNTIYINGKYTKFYYTGETYYSFKESEITIENVSDSDSCYIYTISKVNNTLTSLEGKIKIKREGRMEIIEMELTNKDTCLDGYSGSPIFCENRLVAILNTSDGKGNIYLGTRSVKVETNRLVYHSKVEQITNFNKTHIYNVVKGKGKTSLMIEMMKRMIKMTNYEKIIIGLPTTMLINEVYSRLKDDYDTGVHNYDSKDTSSRIIIVHHDRMLYYIVRYKHNAYYIMDEYDKHYGIYEVIKQNYNGILMTATPEGVTVTEANYKEVNIHYDTKYEEYEEIIMNKNKGKHVIIVNTFKSVEEKMKRLKALKEEGKIKYDIEKCTSEENTTKLIFKKEANVIVIGTHGLRTGINYDADSIYDSGKITKITYKTLPESVAIKHEIAIIDTALMIQTIRRIHRFRENGGDYYVNTSHGKIVHKTTNVLISQTLNIYNRALNGNADKISIGIPIPLLFYLTNTSLELDIEKYKNSTIDEDNRNKISTVYNIKHSYNNIHLNFLTLGLVYIVSREQLD